jgi:hypothetical protein
MVPELEASVTFEHRQRPKWANYGPYMKANCGLREERKWQTMVSLRRKS